VEFLAGVALLQLGPLLVQRLHLVVMEVLAQVAVARLLKRRVVEMAQKVAMAAVVLLYCFGQRGTKNEIRMD
jgi:hypothetical protein